MTFGKMNRAVQAALREAMQDNREFALDFLSQHGGPLTTYSAKPDEFMAWRSWKWMVLPGRWRKGMS